MQLTTSYETGTTCVKILRTRFGQNKPPVSALDLGSNSPKGSLGEDGGDPDSASGSHPAWVPFVMQMRNLTAAELNCRLRQNSSQSVGLISTDILTLVGFLPRPRWHFGGRCVALCGWMAGVGRTAYPNSKQLWRRGGRPPPSRPQIDFAHIEVLGWKYVPSINTDWAAVMCSSPGCEGRPMS